MTIKFNIPTDERGLIGRECPKCQEYFKVKFGTGLPLSTCHCPYCFYTGNNNEFFTKDQIEYAESVALKEAMERVIKPGFRKLERSFKKLESATRGGLIQIKVKTKRSLMVIPHSYYREKEVETYIICDNCGLEFAVYGIFANCPDCGKLNALTILSKSIEVARKRLHILDSIKDEAELQGAILENAISGGVSTFDALGKALQFRYPDNFPQRPKNLFQNLQTLYW
jgi:Zn finger protein HypA/HybF involved in hydrogenase expression